MLDLPEIGYDSSTRKERHVAERVNILSDRVTLLIESKIKLILDVNDSVRFSPRSL